MKKVMKKIIESEARMHGLATVMIRAARYSLAAHPEMSHGEVVATHVRLVHGITEQTVEVERSGSGDGD